MNWLDYTFLAIILVTTILGVVKGLIRQVIGLVAVVIGLILASLYYHALGVVFQTFMHNELLANFLGFVAIFVCILILGAILGRLLTKAMIGPLALINRAFGGVFGLVKSILICGILVFAMTAFQIGRPSLEESRLAPFCFAITKAVVNMIPQDLRAKFNSSYKEIRKGGGSRGQKI